MREADSNGPGAATQDDALRSQTLRGARWVTIGRVVVESGLLVSSVLLARLLSPADFGRASVAAVVVAVASGLLTGGFGSPLIQAPVLEEKRIRTAYGLSLVSGVTFMLLCAGASFPLRGVYDEQTATLILLASPVFLIGSVGAIPQAMLSRALDFRTTTINEISGALAGTAVAVVCAFAGVGSASIILGLLTTATVGAGLALRAARPPGPRLDRAEAIAVGRFGLPASLSSLLGTAIRNSDYALLALRFAPTQVGLYFRAYQLGVDYQGKISGIVLRILFPVLSRTGSRERLRATRSRIVRLHATVIFPLLTLLAVTAETLIPWLYGDQWIGAVPLTQVLTIAGAAATIGTGIGPLMFAIGRPTALLINNAISFCGFVCVILAFSRFGLFEVCVAVAVYRVLAVLTSQYFLSQRLVGIPLRQTVVSDAGPAFACCACMALAVVPAYAQLVEWGVPSVVTLAGTALVGTLVYCVALRGLFAASWADVVLVAQHVIPRLKSARSAGASA